MLDELTELLIVALIEDRLAITMPIKYQPFTSATKFAKQIFQSFCDGHRYLTVHYWEIKKYAPFLSEYFLLDDYEWINLDINMLFPT